MEQVLWTSLPTEIVTDILSRLPVRTIISCKCVCKSWLDLIETRDFAHLHYSKSVPGLAATIDLDAADKIVQLADVEHDDLPIKTITKLNFNLTSTRIEGSVHGLLLLSKFKGNWRNDLYLCNPITREYIHLLRLQQYPDYSCSGMMTCGFGVSKNSGQYKVVGIFHKRARGPEPKLDCMVYTIGTGSWRRVAFDSTLNYCYLTSGAFSNGKLHWLTYDIMNKTPRISCFDLETEVFSTFCPYPIRDRKKILPTGLVALEGCLYLCDYGEKTVDIWSMKEYGVDESWTKEFMFKESEANVMTGFYPIKVYKDGAIFMARSRPNNFCYVAKNGTTRLIDTSEKYAYITSVLHIPTFFSLKSFAKEKSISF